jgi:Conjugative transposon protein TcpC
MSEITDNAGRTRVEELRRSVRPSRLAARAPRHLASAALLVLVAIGLRTIFTAPSPAGAVARPAAGADAPSEDLALRFARAYLAYDAADPGAREEALAPYLGAGLSTGAGFDASRGSRRVLWEDVASDQPALQGGHVITVAAEVSAQAAPLYLAVTVRHDSGRPLSLIGYPALVGAPAIAASAPEPARQAVSDPEVTQVVERVLRNYLAGSATDLRADLTDDAQVTLPTVALRMRRLAQVDWVAGSGSGAVLATASAEDDEGDTYTLTYELGIDWHERPYVDFIEVVPTRS